MRLAAPSLHYIAAFAYKLTSLPFRKTLRSLVFVFSFNSFFIINVNGSWVFSNA